MTNSKYINSINLNHDTNFPYLVLEVNNHTSIPHNPGFEVMHWHEDLQFIFVIEGSIQVNTLDTFILLNEGEGIFINAGVIHDIKQLTDCHYYSFLFPDSILMFYPNSPVFSSVTQITRNSQITTIKLSNTISWQTNILDFLIQLISLHNHPSQYYAYEVLNTLSSLWLHMMKNVIVPQITKEKPIHIRMQKMLKYIETHFSDDIGLASLAQSANISKSECIRCFKTALSMTPYQYIMDYRLQKACILLLETDESIGNIASSVGFHQMSHFGKCFKEKTGYSPRAYRFQ